MDNKQDLIKYFSSQNGLDFIKNNSQRSSKFDIQLFQIIYEQFDNTGLRVLTKIKNQPSESNKLDFLKELETQIMKDERFANKLINLFKQSESPGDVASENSLGKQIEINNNATAQVLYNENKGNQTFNQYLEKNDFAELTLEQLNSPEFKKNLQTDYLLKILGKEKLLVLGGDIGINKDNLALEIAYFLGEKIAQTNPGFDKDSKLIKLWRRSSNQKIIDINIELKETKSPTIFVINEITPNDVKLNLRGIHKAVKSTKKFYIIVTTDESVTTWRREYEDKIFFPDLTEVNFYSPNILLNELNKQIKNHELNQELNDKLSSEGEQILQYYSSEGTAQTERKELLALIAEDLKTIRNIERFVDLFCSSKSLPILQLIKDSKIDTNFINRLYYDRLNAREQLLALGLSFFNGLFEDQLFAALEKVVEIAWQKRDVSLRALDYCDLEKLQNVFFNLTSNNLYESEPPDFKVVKTQYYKVDIRSITIISQGNRRILFQVAWGSHRRQILAALPVLVQLVEQSVTENYFQWELYGCSMRCENLRSVISNTLSEIALISISATSGVRSSLITLAQNKNFLVRDVAAKAIGQWHDPYIYSKDIKPKEALFSTMQFFYGITLEKEYKPQNRRNSNLEDYYIQEPGEEREDNISKDYIGTTVSLILKYAARYEKDKISNELYDWLKELSKSKLRLVHHYFGYYTLFDVVPQHLRQSRIVELLRESIQNHKDDFLNYAIARCLSRAYDYLENREEVAKILDQWYKESINKYSQRTNSSKITHDDALLKTVALTYGIIDYDSISTELTVNLSFTRLHRILVYEKHPFVSSAVVVSICLIAQKNLDQIKLLLQPLVSEFSQEIAEEIIETLTNKIYSQEARNTIRIDNYYLQEESFQIVQLAYKIVQQDQEKVTQKVIEKVLRAIALFYEAVQQDQEKGTLTIQEAFLSLYKFLSKEDNSFVRETILISIRVLASKHFGQIEPQLEALFSIISNDKHKDLIEILTEIYLDQRANLKGSNDRIRVNGYQYPVWVNSERPLTAMEKAIFRWVKNDKNVASHQIAIQASVSFARALEEEEAQKINKYKEKRRYARK